MSSRGILIASLVSVAALLNTGCGAGTPAASAPVPRPQSVPLARDSHVVLIVMENKEYSEVVGSPGASYLSRLAHRYAIATNFYGIAHPSLPNYLALTGGSTFGVTSNCTGCSRRETNVIDQLEHAGVSWKAYMEGLPRPCFTGAGAAGYVKKHDPFVYYEDIARSPTRCRKVVPDRQLGEDLSAGRLPTFAWITPGLCNDTHDCSVAVGDRYLSKLVPSLLPALGPHGMLLITWDEGSSDKGCCGGLAAGGRVATLIVGPDVRRGARLGADYSHYSILHTIDLAFGLRPLRGASSASSRALDAAFVRPPRLRPSRGARMR